ncbi:MAG: rhodanese-like domain-containing protein [Acidobacteriota bacterium]
MDPHFDGVIFKTHSGEVRRRLTRPYPPFRILDVRPRSEWERVRIPGSISASDGITGFPEGADARTEYLIVGRQPEDPAMRRASLALRDLGAHRVVEMTGGMMEWEMAGGPVEKA